jgi:hypothetical protein
LFSRSLPQRLDEGRIRDRCITQQRQNLGLSAAKALLPSGVMDAGGVQTARPSVGYFLIMFERRTLKIRVAGRGSENGPDVASRPRSCFSSSRACCGAATRTPRWRSSRRDPRPRCCSPPRRGDLACESHGSRRAAARGPRLFNRACELMTAGIRHRDPGASEEAVLERRSSRSNVAHFQAAGVRVVDPFGE